MRRVNFNCETFARYSVASLIIIGALFLLIHAGCCRDHPKGGQKQPADGRITEGGRDWKDNPEVVSPLILREPLYDCTNVVWVSGFILGSEVTIFEGANPIGSSPEQWSARFRNEVEKWAKVAKSAGLAAN